MRKLARLIGCLLFVFHQAAAADAIERWLSWQSLQGEFLQRHSDANQSLVSVSTGKFAVKRPSFAKWEVQEPDPQTYVVGPEGAWHLDGWLEVATFYDNTEIEDSSVMTLLNTDIEQLKQRFIISQTTQSLRFQARDPAAQMQTIEIIMHANGYPQSLAIETQLGQALAVEFSELSSRLLPDSHFEFTVPPGIEIQ
ncbi:MAG: outer membrane lipoprotein carrier protein LolA [Proteobacteria bacterium]|jgi:outer membrane lipoprotein carrier protein|nr:outer membrane lipoprotein carrier protein LolA [Pseudomonadota bacterium]